MLHILCNLFNIKKISLEIIPEPNDDFSTLLLFLQRISSGVFIYAPRDWISNVLL